MKVNFEVASARYDALWAKYKLCFMQHRAWGEVKTVSYIPHFLAVNETPLAVHTRKLPVISGRYGYSPRAFSQQCLPSADKLAAAADEICRHFRLSHLVIEPNIILNNPADTDSYLSAGFMSNDDTVQPRHSRLIDLKKTDEELLADMTKDVRRRIRRGTEDGYKFSEDSSTEGLDRFYEGLSQVAQRAKFSIQSKSYFERILKNFPAGMPHIYFCHDTNGQLLYALFSINDNGIWRRVYGGPTLEGRQGDAAQFTAWQVIQEAKSNGVTTIDLWGVAPYTSDGYVSGHALSGVSKFKASLGGQDVTYWPQLIWVRDKTRFAVYSQLVKTYRSLKRLKYLVG